MNKIRIDLTKEDPVIVDFYIKGEHIRSVLFKPSKTEIKTKANLKREPKGYWYDKRRDMFQVKLTIDGVRKNLGYFKTKEEALEVYQLEKLKEIERKRKVKEAKNNEQHKFT